MKHRGQKPRSQEYAPAGLLQTGRFFTSGVFATFQLSAAFCPSLAFIGHRFCKVRREFEASVTSNPAQKGNQRSLHSRSLRRRAGGADVKRSEARVTPCAQPSSVRAHDSREVAMKNSKVAIGTMLLVSAALLATPLTAEAGRGGGGGFHGGGGGGFHGGGGGGFHGSGGGGFHSGGAAGGGFHRGGVGGSFRGG